MHSVLKFKKLDLEELLLRSEVSRSPELDKEDLHSLGEDGL